MPDPINKTIGFRYQQEDSPMTSLKPIFRFYSLLKEKMKIYWNKFDKLSYGFSLGLLIFLLVIFFEKNQRKRSEVTTIEFDRHSYSLEQIVDTLLALGIVNGVYRDTLMSKQEDIYFESRSYTTREALGYALMGTSLEYNLRGKILEFFDRTYLSSAERQGH